MRRTRAGAFALIVLAGLGSPVSASANDLTRFESACPKARTFLLKDVPPEVDGDAVLGALCPCLKTAFEAYSQPEIDALTADLRTGTSDEAKATYLQYGDLQAKATNVLEACFETDEVKQLIAPKH